MTVEILYSWGPGENRLAVLRDGRLTDLTLVRPELLAGAVVLGRVVELAPKMGAVFVDIGQDKPAYLQAPKGLTQGQALLVQVKADAQGGKGATLTSDIALAGPMLTYFPTRSGISVTKQLAAERRERLIEVLTGLMGEGEGVAARTQASAADDEELQYELDVLRGIWAGIQENKADAKAPEVLWRPDPILKALAENPGASRIIVDDGDLYAAASETYGDIVELQRDCFAQYDVEEAIQAAQEPVVPLQCGGRVTFEHTAALTAIDVDSGPANAIEANTQAVAVIARQLRLRNIAGQMVVDFVSAGGKGALFKLVNALKQAVARDPVATHVIGVTGLGLVELTRERKGQSLAELTQTRSVGPSTDAVALSLLRQVLREAPHRPGRALGIAASADVAAALARRADAVAEVETRLGRKLPIRTETAFAPGTAEIEDAQP